MEKSKLRVLTMSKIEDLQKRIDKIEDLNVKMYFFSFLQSCTSLQDYELLEYKLESEQQCKNNNNNN